jgi:predicted permease
VLGQELWVTAFAADRAILGRAVELNRELMIVVGVAAPGTYGGPLYDASFFAPISTQRLVLPAENNFDNPRSGWLFVVGRRAASASLSQVRAELAVLARDIDRAQPGRTTTFAVERATPLTLARTLAIGIGSVVMTAFGLVLLMACTNVANLVVARGAERTAEIAVRVSLGASRQRIVAQLLTESLLIAGIGGALGALLSFWSFRALIAWLVPSIMPAGLPPIVLDTSPDARVLAFTMLVTLGTGLLFGLAPALRSSRPDLSAVLKQASPDSVARRGKLAGVLLAAQAAMCMLLTIAAALLLRGLYASQTIEPGFAYRDVTVAEFDLRGAGYDAAGAAAFQERVLETARALPGVTVAAYALREPLGDDIVFAMLRRPEDDARAARYAELNAAMPGTFDVLELPLRLGRDFTAAELAGPPAVAIVSNATARNFWPDDDPIGRSLVWQIAMPGEPQREVTLRVVGVVDDAQLRVLGAIDPYYVYVPAAPRFREVLLVKSRADSSSTAAALQAAVRELDAGLVVSAAPLEDNLAWWRRLAATVTTLAATLGGLSVVLAVVGIYGVVARFVSGRRKEIGIRVALGARPRAVLGMVLAQTLRPVAAGAALGIAAALAASRILLSVLFGASSVDPLAIGAAIALVAAVTLAAGAIAARPATRADPFATLRTE